MQPLFDNLNVIKGQFAPGGSDARKIDDLQKNGQLVIEALAFIRGRSLSETFCIIDEAQNLTPHEINENGIYRGYPADRLSLSGCTE